MEVAEISQHWKNPLAVVDTGLKAVHFIRSHPGLVSGGFAALLSLRAWALLASHRRGGACCTSILPFFLSV